MPRYQGKEVVTTIQAPTKKELSKLIRSTRVYAGRHGMGAVSILERGKDPDGGYRAIITAHNWNPLEWVKKKREEGKQKKIALEFLEEVERTQEEKQAQEEELAQEKWEKAGPRALSEEEKKLRLPRERLIEAFGKKGTERFIKTAEVASKEKGELAGEGIFELEKRKEFKRVLVGREASTTRYPEGKPIYETREIEVTPTAAGELARVRKERREAVEAAQELKRQEWKPALELAGKTAKLGAGIAGEMGKGFAHAGVRAARPRGVRAGVVTPIAPRGLYDISGLRQPRMQLGMRQPTGAMMSPSMLTGAGLGQMRQALMPGRLSPLPMARQPQLMQGASTAKLFGLGGGQAVIEQTTLPPALTGLTPTQQRVYEELVAGTPPDAIPIKLGLKKGTVSNAIRQLGEKGAFKQSQSVSTQATAPTGRINPLMIPTGGVNLRSMLPGMRRV